MDRIRRNRDHDAPPNVDPGEVLLLDAGGHRESGDQQLAQRRHLLAGGTGVGTTATFVFVTSADSSSAPRHHREP